MKTTIFRCLIQFMDCFCVLIASFSFIFLIIFSMEMEVYRKFQEGSVETCTILEFFPFTQPQPAYLSCCDPNINPFVINVRILIYNEYFF